MPAVKNKILYFCLSLLLAFGIWLYVITVVSPKTQETFKDIPVEMQNVSFLEERGLIITNISHTKVTLRLSSNRTDLIQLNKDNIRIVADVFNIHEPGVHEVSYTVSYPGNIPNGNVELLSRSPGTIQVTVEQKVSKKLDLTVNYKGAVPDGYLTDEANVQLDTKTVTVSGPKTLVDRVTSAKTVVDIEGRTESFTAFCSVTLYDHDGNVVEGAGLSTDTKSVKVTLQIKQLKEVDVVFDVLYGGGATQQNTTITPSITKLQIAGHKNLLSSITQIHVGTVDLSQVVGDTQIVRSISLPDGVANETGVNEVKITISFEGLLLKRLEVTNIIPVNLPTGMAAHIRAEILSVTVRGTQEDINAITAGDIIASVDFGDTREGESTMPVKIIISEKFPNVGAIGSYTVTANMYKAYMA